MNAVYESKVCRNVSQTEPSIAVRNIDDATYDKRTGYKPYQKPVTQRSVVFSDTYITIGTQIRITLLFSCSKAQLIAARTG